MAIKYKPDHVLAMTGLGNCYYKMNKINEAAEYF